MTNIELIKHIPVPQYGKYSALLARIYMLRHQQADPTWIEIEQLTLYARTESDISDMLAGRGVAREVAADFAHKFCVRILDDIREVEAEVFEENGFSPDA